MSVKAKFNALYMPILTFILGLGIIAKVITILELG